MEATVKTFRFPILVVIPWLAGSCAFLPLGAQNPFRYESESTEADHSVPRLGDVSAGMSMRDVTRTWGEPRHVQYAGHPGAGNQRWVYTHGPTLLGASESRVLYFEDGRLVGWESGGP